MTWFIFAFISIASISVANLFQKLAMKEEKSDPIISSIIFQFLLTFFTFIYAAIKGFELPSINLFFPYILISSFLYAFGTLLFFKAIKIIEASEMTILSGFGAIITIVSAFIFLHERLSILQLTGVLLIIIAVISIKYEGKKFIANKGVLYSLTATTLYGLAVTVDAFILKSYNAISYTPIISFIPGVILCVLYPNKTTILLKNIRQKINPNLGIYSLLYSIQAVTYYLALENGAMASQMNSVFKTEIILTVILASFYLKERKNIGKKIIAAALTTIGVLLIA